MDLPKDVTAAAKGIIAFADAEVIPRHQANQALFEDPRSLYREDGRFSDQLVELIREVRTRSAAAGFYQMCTPKVLGGGGLGHLAYYVAWEALFHYCGPRNWLMLYALAHWAFGPSRLLEQTSPEAREIILPGLMEGSSSRCLGLSEPNAGSDASMITTRTVADGSNEILNRSIAQRLLKGDMEL
jgi:acyl-CoA dehydrogenase